MKTDKVTKVLSSAMTYVTKMERSRGIKTHMVNMVFCGLLKASELGGKDDVILSEVNSLKERFKELEINIYETRMKILDMIPEFLDEDDIKKEKVLFQKMMDTIPDNLKVVSSLDMLDAILKNKTEEIKRFVKEEQKENDSVKKEKKDEIPVYSFNSDDSNQKIGYSVENNTTKIGHLVSVTRRIRENLLEKIYGQDHAIHSFVDGYWNSELIAISDNQRRRPRGVFVFAGPPGVGKTYLAEEAATELGLPFLRLDMSGYSYRDSVSDLIGFAKTYKESRRGLLTDYVVNNPRCFILFDEIEKAHSDVIHLFLQILDAGTLTEAYDNAKVSFKDVTIVFTTNAGRGVYENKDFTDASSLSKKKVMEALETDVDPKTGISFFPAAICSRLGASSVIMFNNLKIQHLGKVCEQAFKKVSLQIGDILDVRISADRKIVPSLLFSEGGKIDARNLTAKSGNFIREEIKKLFSLFSEQSMYNFEKYEHIRFVTELDKESEEIQSFYHYSEKTNVLLVGVDDLPPRVKKTLNDYNIFMAEDEKSANQYLQQNDIDLIMIQVDSEIEDDLEVEKDWIVEEEDEKEERDINRDTISSFDYIPVGSADLSKRRNDLVKLHRKYFDIPIYILETDFFIIDRELEASLMQDGARGVIKLSNRNAKEFARHLKSISNEIYIQNKTNQLKKLSKLIHFETAPKVDEEKKEILIRLRNFSLERIVSLEDQAEVITNTEDIDIRFKNVIGAEEVKKELKFFVDYLKNPKEFIAKGMRPPKGVLLYGQPGTGKTMLAKAMAGEANVAFLSTEASSFVNKYVGSGSESIRKLFEKARKYAPSIVFIDEIDTIGRIRTGSESGREEEAALTALLTEMDGMKIDPKRPVFVLAATNYSVEATESGIGMIDAALIRRFDRKICVELPDKKARQNYLSINLKKAEYSGGDAILKEIAERSVGMSLANLETMVELAKRNAVREKKSITEKLLIDAFETIVHGEKKNWGQNVMERIARHEAGHAVMSWIVGEIPSYVTIVARGSHGGYVQKKDDRAPIATKKDLLNDIKISLGGRAAEIMYYGKEDGISSGASSDLRNATMVAKKIICSFGMDEDMGLVVFDENDITNGYYNEQVYKRINQILKTELENVLETIQNYKESIDKIVEKLLEKNQLNGTEIDDIMCQCDI